MHHLRPRGRLWRAGALDPHRARQRPQNLRGAWLRDHQRRRPRRVRQARAGGKLAAGSLTTCPLKTAMMAKLYFYYAAMNAGKSTTLLQADFNYRERGMQTMLWTAALDERAGAGIIGSRIGLEAEANRYFDDTNLFDGVVKELIKRRLDCIL